jgi:hypothetical protein
LSPTECCAGQEKFRMPSGTPASREVDNRPIDWLCWVFLVGTCLQLTFLHPYIVLVSGERSNLFSGLLCAATLVVVVVRCREQLSRVTKPELLISGVLLVLCVLSSVLGEGPATSLARGFVIMAAGLGGYWSARLLLTSDGAQRGFLWFCAALLVVNMALIVAGIVVEGAIHHYVDVHWHTAAARLILFLFVPVALLGSRNTGAMIAGGALLAADYIVLFLCGKYAGLESAVLIPVGLFVIAACFMRWRVRYTIVILIVLAVMAVAAGNHMKTHAGNVGRTHESVAYRTESLFFTWHLAVHNPVFGVGLWAPRDRFLAEYQARYPYVDKQRFIEWTHKFRTSENNYLTFLCDLGFPFALLYFGSVVLIGWRLFCAALKPAEGSVFPALALLLTVVGEAVHFLVYEGLFHSQISWFFHMVLGLSVGAVPQSSVPWGALRTYAAKVLVLVAVGVAGAVIGYLMPPGTVEHLLDAFKR